jgi:hypothetical protein
VIRQRVFALAVTIPLAAVACGSGGDEETTQVDPEADASTTIADDMVEEMAHDMAPVTFTVRIENISGQSAIRRSVAFNTPTDATAPGPLLPGGTYQAVVAASPGERLSFATMFVQSNDSFISAGVDGVELYEVDGKAFRGDVTDQLLLLDAGTESDEEPDNGPNQAPRQAGPDTGPIDPDNVVRMVEGHQASSYLAVDVVALDEGYFMVTLENGSDETTFATPFAPGVAVTHVRRNPLFVLGEADSGSGLEALAEDGNRDELEANLQSQISLPTPIAPLVAVVHEGDNPIFTAGTNSRADGLEALAEDGSPSDLAEALSGIAIAAPDGEDGPGPILPGEAYTFSVEGSAHARLSLAAMFVQSNDWFIALDSINLYDGDSPINGDVSDLVTLWDADTEADQTPGVGTDQAPRQAGPNTGASDADDAARLVDTDTVAVGDDIVRITVTAG